MKGHNERASVCGSRDDFEFLTGKYASADSAYIGAVSDRPEHLTQPWCKSSLSQSLREALMAELWLQLWVMHPGQRIRLLRTVLGWTQQQAAIELEISRRTLIRHEQGQNRRAWMRGSLLQRLRQVEIEHEQQLFAYLSRV